MLFIPAVDTLNAPRILEVVPGFATPLLRSESWKGSVWWGQASIDNSGVAGRPGVSRDQSFIHSSIQRITHIRPAKISMTLTP